MAAVGQSSGTKGGREGRLDVDDQACSSVLAKMVEEQKAIVLQKYARAWLARRRFQHIRRFVLNIQLSYRVQRLQKKLEDQVAKEGPWGTDAPFLCLSFQGEASVLKIVADPSGRAHFCGQDGPFFSG